MNKSLSTLSTNEDLWGTILSQSDEKVRGVVKILDQEAIENVSCRLRRMVSEDGWHPAQQASAAFALQVIKTQI